MSLFQRAKRALEQRMLNVEDPVEMKTEEGTEILVAARPEDFLADEVGEDDEGLLRRRGSETPAHAMRREGHVGVRGYGNVS